MPVARFFTGRRQGPLYHCEDAVSMISHIKMLGSSSLLELASLHGIHLDVNTPERENASRCHCPPPDFRGMSRHERHVVYFRPFCSVALH